MTKLATVSMHSKEDKKKKTKKFCKIKKLKFILKGSYDYNFT